MFERNFDRLETRDPPREGGGAMRAFILIALLGGAALAGGLYFGGGMPDFGGTPAEEQTADNTIPSAPPLDEGLDAPADAPDERIAFTDAAPQRPQRAEPPPRRETTQQAAARTERTETAAPTPTPTTSWETTAAANQGPVSLSPGSTGSSGTPASVIPLPPSTAPAATEASAPATPAAPRAGAVTFSQRPTARRITDLYPTRAAREGVGGRVVLDCGVRGDQSLSCSVASESPPGMGFGSAALSASTSYRANSTLSNGQTSNGARTRIAVQFQAPSQ
jgi:protein TonB